MLFSIDNLKKESIGFSENEETIKFSIKNNIYITVDKNDPSNLFRNQDNKIYSISKDGGKTWQVALTSNFIL